MKLGTVCDNLLVLVPAALCAVLAAGAAALAAPAATEFEYHFPSTVPGLDIPNAHVVYRGKGEVLRGAAPRDALGQLLGYGVTDVIIFKNDTGGEIAGEVESLKERGVPGERIANIPFRWKGIASFRVACEQTVQALRALNRAANTEGRKAYFHCTMGEDRTGALAGLFRMLREKVSIRDAFERELCEHGYEAGNAGKPATVVNTIRAELTPVFVKMAYLIDKGLLSLSKLDASVCKTDPAYSPDFKADPRYRAKSYTCSASPDYVE